MAEYTDDEAGRSRRIVEGLLSEEQPRADLQQGLSIVDIEQDSKEFLGDLEILSLIGTDVPALRVGEDGLVPVSLSMLSLDPFRRGASRRPLPPFFLRDPREYYYYALRGEGKPYEGFETISAEEARTNFIRRATDFLALRIAAIRGIKGGGPSDPPKSILNMLQRSGGSRTSVPGCSFSVTANTYGLRVFWSGAYYVTGNYFGHPTFPTVGVLQSGIYIFGVDGGAYGNVIQWDTSAICRLPGKPSVHVNY